MAPVAIALSVSKFEVQAFQCSWRHGLSGVDWRQIVKTSLCTPNINWFKLDASEFKREMTKPNEILEDIKWVDKEGRVIK